MNNSINSITNVQRPHSLAGQTATIVHKDGTEQEVTFGPGVVLQWKGDHRVRTDPPAYPEIDGYLTDRDFPKVEGAELIIGNDIFKFSCYGRGFFHASEPVSSRTLVNYGI